MTLTDPNTSLLVFGPGYSAHPVMEKALNAGWEVFGTYRSEDSKVALETSGFIPVAFDAAKLPKAHHSLHVLISIPPGPDGDPTLAVWRSFLEKRQIESISYLSSTNVYGDHGGAWVDETTPAAPTLERGKRRVEAENEWLALGNHRKIRTFIFRLAGIYGPGRNAFASLKSGKARCIIKPGQNFGRIHLADITNALWLAMTGKHTGGIFNLADDAPCPPHLVIETAAEMAGLKAPPHENWEEAEMSPMARSFYLESKKVRNDKVKTELGLNFTYATYKEGLRALLKTDI